MMGALEDKCAVVTGASSGIGTAIAHAMARAGARVVLVGRDADRLEVSRSEIEAAGGTACGVAVDLTDDAAPATIVDTAVERFGSLDVIVHSAGIFEPRPFEESSLESFDRQMDLNVRAPFALTQAAMPHLLDGGRLLRDQGRRRAHDPGAGRRAGSAWHPGQRTCAGQHPHTDERAPARVGRVRGLDGRAHSVRPRRRRG
jgi:NAD(P)-dependent dehydrogenase (short-subunit alcohol dehydrogenase family)